jgi:L-amino acid N-acyltransferase YncA
MGARGDSAAGREQARSQGDSCPSSTPSATKSPPFPMPLSGYTIRTALEADLPAIVEIYNATIPSRLVTADLEPVTVAARRPWFAAHQKPSHPLWVYCDSVGAVCAWLSFDSFYPRAAYDGTAMIALYVDPAHRRLGLGRNLLLAAINQAPGLGLHTLLGYIFGHNEPSLRLFAAHDFSRWAHLPRVAVLDGIERDLIIVGRRVRP